MRLQRQSNAQVITLDPASTLGHGGEARVYAVPPDETLVAKVYHKRTDAQTHKLAVMLANPPENPMAGQGHISIAWPIDLLRKTEGGDGIVGFLMPRVKGMHSILDFYNPKTRRQKCPFFNYFYLHRTARNLAAAVGALHGRGYCIGDVNESNILVSNTALVTLVDTDSFQVRDPGNGAIYRCCVGKPEFTPPELQGKSFHSIERVFEHDLFGLAVVIFQLLMEGTHPFSGIFQGKGDPPPYEERIAAGHFSYSQKRCVPYLATPIAPPWEILHPTLRQLFVRCFEDGHSNPQLRPSAQTWQSALKEAETALITCKTNKHHVYGNHLSVCPWCERTVRLGGRDPFPSQETVQKGQHLQPVPRKKVIPTTKRPITPKIGSLSRQMPLLTVATSQNRSKKKGFSPLVLGSLCAVLGLLEIMVIAYDLKLPSEITAKLFPSNTNPNSLDSINNAGQVSLTYYNQGNASYKLGDYEGAIENFTQALRINPDDPKAYVNRGNVRYEIAQHSGDPDKHYKGAINDFNRALILNPQEVEAYVSRGTVRYEIAQYSKDADKDYQAAIVDFNQALRLDPRHSKAYVERGNVRYKLAQYSGDPHKDYMAAIEDFNQALRINPQEAEAYVKRGLVRYEIAQYGSGGSNQEQWGAVEDLKKAAKLFLEQGNVDHYQQALGNICVALEKNCDSFLQNPEKFLIPSSQPLKQNQK